MNDLIPNWKKLQKFIKSEKTDNRTNGRDMGYTYEEIQRILEFADQRIRTMFLILVSAGSRVGALRWLRLRDLEKTNGLYKIVLYEGARQ